MSRVRLYVDEDASEASVLEGLRRAGIDVLTANDAGNLKVPDELQLRFAAADGRVLYSLNARDFARLHAEFLRNNLTHAGIVLIPRQRYGPGEKLRRLRELLDNTPAAELVNQMFFL